jgi:hypothetical protein
MKLKTTSSRSISRDGTSKEANGPYEQVQRDNGMIGPKWIRIDLTYHCP